ncbi:MAG: PAS domain S-box protein [Cyanobacteria bacterium P01_C01_bin.70]
MCDRPFHDQMPALLQAMNAEGRLIAVTDRWLRWLGYERLQVIGRPWQDFLTVASRSQTLASATPFLNTVITAPERLQWQTTQGQIVSADLTAEAIYDATGRIQTWLVSLGSVTPAAPVSSAVTLEREPLKQQLSDRFNQIKVEQLLQIITATVEEYFWIDSIAERRMVYSNLQCEEIWGISENALQESLDALMAAIHPADQTAFEHFLAVRSHATDWQELEFRIDHPQKGLRWLRSRAYPLLDCQGGPEWVVGVTADVTEQKRTAANLREVEERFRLLIDNLQDVFWLTNLQTGHNIYVSPAFERLWQLPRAVLAEEPFAFAQRIHPDDRDRVIAELDQCIAQASDFDTEYRLLLPDGGSRWIRDRGSIILDGADVPIKMAGIATDITAQKRDKLRLQQYERIIAANPDPVCVVGQDYTYRLVNQAFQAWFGDASSLSGQHVVQCFSEDFFTTVAKPRFDQALQGNTQYFEEWVHNPHKKEPKFISITYTPYYEADGQISGVINSIRDVTALKQARDSLSQITERLQFYVQNSPLAVIEWDRRQKIQNWSEQATNCFGWSAAEMLGQHVSELPIFSSEANVNTANCIGRLVQGEVQNQIFVTHNVTRDGREIYCEWYNSVLKTEWGQVISILSLVQDVTDRRQTQLALQASEERWQLAITGSNEGIWDWHLPTNEVFYSPRWKELLGYDDAELENVEATWRSRIHPDDRERVQAAMMAHLQGQTATYYSEYRMRHRTGDYIWILSRGQAIFNDAGEPVRISGSHADVSDRKQAELDLQASQKLLQLVFDHLPQRVFWKDPEGRFLGCNQAFATDMGQADPSQLIGKIESDFQIFPPEVQEMFRDRDRQVMTSDRAITFEECPQFYADGRRRWVSTTKSPFKTPQGKLLGLFGCYEDVTDRVLAKQSLQRYARMVEAASDAVCLVDANYCYQIINRTYRDWYGYNDQPILGQTVADVLGMRAFEQRLQPLLDRCLQGETLQYERWFEFPHLGKRFRNVTLTPYREDTGEITGIVASIRDLTALKAAEAAQRHSEKVFRAIFEQSAVSMAQIALDGTYLKVNPAFCQLVGLDEPDLIGEHYANVTHPDDLSSDIDLSDAVARGQVPAQRIDKRFICADGSVRHVQAVVTAVQDERGQPVFLSSVYNDVTKQVLAKRSLRSVVEGTASVTGEAFFPVLARQLADALGVDHILINRLNDDETLTTIVFLSHQECQPAMTYPRVKTPCDQTLMQGLYCCPEKVREQFPEDEDLVMLNAESYIGVALTGSDGDPIGEICAMHSEPIRHLDNAAALLIVFAARASAELERQWSIQTLKTREANWRNMLNNMPMLLNAVDDNGLVTLWNKECERVTGYSAAEVIGNPEALAWFYPDSSQPQSASKSWGDRASNYRNQESTLTCKDGSTRIIAWSNLSGLFPIADLGSWEVGVDVTERRRAEDQVRQLNQALEDQNQRLEELVELRTAELVTFMNTLPDQIFVVERTENTLTFGNQEAIKFAQCSSRQEYEGKRIDDCFPVEQAAIYAQQNREVFETGEVLHLLEAMDTAEGLLYLDTYKIPLKRPDGEVYALIGTSRDITELVEARQAIEQQATQLKETNQELQSFSYSVSHDLRAPLRHINGFIAALKQRLKATDAAVDAKIVHYVDVIEKSSFKMGLLIDGLLTLSRVGRREMNWRSVALKPLVEQALALASDFPGKPQDNLHITVDELPLVCGDATLLQQVFSNLIGNAVKFSRDRTPAVIHVGHQDGGTFFIQDNGAGFDMTYADKLFSPFQRLHKQGEFQGTGIGLAIVNRIIHRHGGRIWAASEINHGTTIYFTLPLASASKKPPGD